MIQSLRKFFLSSIAVLVVFVIHLIFFGSLTSAETPNEKLERLATEVEQYVQEIDRLKSQANTLSNQIAQYDAQINLTAIRISQTEEKILILGGRIDQLEDSLTALTDAFSSRVSQTYRMARFNQPVLMLILSPNLTNAVSSYHYLQKIQEADRELLLRLEKAQDNYEVEKLDQEILQTDLEEQKTALDSQKAVKASLLEVTRNDERRYQSLLSVARAEFEAIQAIIAGRGDEEEIGLVVKGERIATVIQGASCNSSGAHVHFIVRSGDSAQNPFSYLKSGIDHENCSGSSCGSGDGDPFGPSGSWDWPISPRIKFSQGYGSTWAVKNTWVGKIYNFHNGIDINSESSPEVRAVESGVLYRGSYGGSVGCRLRYVRVDHEGSDVDTLYLHINY